MGGGGGWREKKGIFWEGISEGGFDARDQGWAGDQRAQDESQSLFPLVTFFWTCCHPSS
jgi:hypothetical protein